MIDSDRTGPERIQPGQLKAAHTVDLYACMAASESALSRVEEGGSGGPESESLTHGPRRCVRRGIVTFIKRELEHALVITVPTVTGDCSSGFLKPRMGQGGTRSLLRFGMGAGGLRQAMVWFAREAGRGALGGHAVI